MQRIYTHGHSLVVVRRWLELLLTILSVLVLLEKAHLVHFRGINQDEQKQGQPVDRKEAEKKPMRGQTKKGRAGQAVDSKNGGRVNVYIMANPNGCGEPPEPPPPVLETNAVSGTDVRPASLSSTDTTRKPLREECIWRLFHRSKWKMFKAASPGGKLVTPALIETGDSTPSTLGCSYISEEQ